MDTPVADRNMRAAEREGTSLAHRLRAGLVVPGYTSAREVRCRFTTDSSPVPFDPLDLVRLWAFLGDDEAREIVPNLGWDRPSGTRPSWSVTDALVGTGFDVWLVLLRDLCAKLPPARCEVECPGWCHEEHGPDCTCCSQCYGTGTVTHDTPAERFLLVVAAHAVARECFGGGWGDTHEGCEGAHDYGPCEPVGDALDACAAWIAEPTPEREEAWVDASEPVDVPDWAPGPSWALCELASCLTESAEILGEPRVREVAARAIMEVSRG